MQSLKRCHLLLCDAGPLPAAHDSLLHPSACWLPGSQNHRAAGFGAGAATVLSATQGRLAALAAELKASDSAGTDSFTWHGTTYELPSEAARIAIHAAAELSDQLAAAGESSRLQDQHRRFTQLAPSPTCCGTTGQVYYLDRKSMVLMSAPGLSVKCFLQQALMLREQQHLQTRRSPLQPGRRRG